MNRTCNGLLLLTIVVHGSTWNVIAADPPTPETRQLIDVLAAAQDANMAAYPRGRVTGSFTDTRSGRSATFVAIWDGDNYFCDAQCRELARKPSGEMAEIETQRIQLRTKTEAIFYQPGAMLVQRVRDGRMEGWPMLRLSPQDSWFQPLPPGDTNWGVLLEGYLAPDSEVNCTAQEHEDGFILVTAIHRELGFVAKTTYSLRHGGNVVSCRSENPEGLPGVIVSSGRYTWERVGDNRWRPRLIEFRRSADGDPEGDDANVVTLRIDTFDPSPSIPRNRFTPGSLNLPDGTLVEEFEANERRYRLGQRGRPEAKLTEEVFRSLAEQLKAQGFWRSDERN